jgi:hypothetical protein
MTMHPPMSATTWTIAGVAVPFACIPPELGFPSIFPVHLDATVATEDYSAMFVLQPPNVRLNYLTADDNHTVVGYQILLVSDADPVPDLAARWGPVAAAGISPSADVISRRFWRAPAKQLLVEVVKLRKKPFWNIDFTRI